MGERVTRLGVIGVRGEASGAEGRDESSARRRWCRLVLGGPCWQLTAYLEHAKELDA